MKLWNLFVLHKVKPLWLSKLIANIFGFIAMYPIALHNKETALLLSLFLAAYLYRNMQIINVGQKNDFAIKDTDKIDSTIDCKNDLYQMQINDFAITQFMISCFCACLFVFTTWQIYTIQALCGCIFIRIYDYYKPSLIGRFYEMQINRASNHIFGSIIGLILCGILSGASVMLIYFLYTRFAIINN